VAGKSEPWPFSCFLDYHAMDVTNGVSVLLMQGHNGALNIKVFPLPPFSENSCLPFILMMKKYFVPAISLEKAKFMRDTRDTGTVQDELL
jgi:hypothetical protein